MAYTIEAHGLRKAYGETRVLEGLDLEIEPGEVFALLGPNGAGKTTTVRILSTLLAPDAGSARVAGHDVVREAKAVRSAISLTAQEAAVDGLLTGAENLRMMARLRRVKDKRRVDALLEQFDLDRRREPPRRDLQRRHAAAAGPGDEPDRAPAGDLPRRAHDRAWTRAAATRSGRRSRRSPTAARRSC